MPVSARSYQGALADISPARSRHAEREVMTEVGIFTFEANLENIFVHFRRAGDG